MNQEKVASILTKIASLILSFEGVPKAKVVDRGLIEIVYEGVIIDKLTPANQIAKKINDAVTNARRFWWKSIASDLERNGVEIMADRPEGSENVFVKDGKLCIMVIDYIKFPYTDPATMDMVNKVLKQY